MRGESPAGLAMVEQYPALAEPESDWRELKDAYLR